MKKIFLSAPMFLILINSGLLAQNSFWKSGDAYLSQKPPGDTPIVFAPGRLADPGYWVGSRVGFTKDGKQFIYGTNTNWFDGRNQKLKYVKFSGETWQRSTLLFNYFGEPTFSADNTSLYLTGRNGAIFQTRLSDTGWVTPTEFLMRSYTLYNFMPTQSGH